MTADGAHEHPAITAALEELQRQHAALEARVSKLEAAPPPGPDPEPPALYAPIWPVTRVPEPTATWQWNGDFASLRDVAANGGHLIELPAGVTNPGGPITVGAETILHGPEGMGCRWDGQGIYVLQGPAIVDNIFLPTIPGGGNDDGIRVYGRAATQVMVMRCTIPDAGDECIDIWDGADPLVGGKRVTIERNMLGMGVIRADNHPWSLIAGGAGHTMLGLYANVMGGGFRNPFINGNVEVWEALNLRPRWGIQAGGYVNGARAYIERSDYAYTGYHWARAHEPNNTGADDPSSAIRRGDGNIYAKEPPRTLGWNESRVSLPLYPYRVPLNPSNAAIYEYAGAATPR